MAALRASFDLYDLIGAVALAGLGVGVAGATHDPYVGLSVVSAIALVVVVVGALRGIPPTTPRE